MFLWNFGAGGFEMATRDFSDDLRPVVTTAMLADLKKQFDQQAGVFLSVTEVHQRRQEGFRAIELIARFSKSPVSVVVVFDPLDRIAAINANPIGPEPALEAAARALLANFIAARYDEAVKAFDDTMRKQLPPPALADLATSVADTFGTYQSVTGVKQNANPPYRVIELTLAYTKRGVSFRVAFDLQNRVAALQISPLPVQP